MTSSAKPLDLRRLLEGVGEPLLVVDPAGRIAYLNAACGELLARPAGDVLGKPAREFGLEPPPEALASGQAALDVHIRRPGSGTTTLRGTFLALGLTSFDAGKLVRGGPGTFEPRGTLAWLAPLDKEPLARPEASALDARSLHDELRTFRARCREGLAVSRLVGGSGIAARIREQVAVAAAATASVLIVGPRGSGRERLAHTIHYAAHPGGEAGLVALDCEVLPGETLRERLAPLINLHHRQAAPPVKATLLLLNVDLASADAQADLATALAARRVAHRVMATARGDKTPASPGNGPALRRDLALALSTIAIEIPPLVERLDDLPLLAQSLLEECNASGKQLAGFSPAALERLLIHDWPGELDELQRTIREAHAQASGTHVDVADLPERVRLSPTARKSARGEQTIALDAFLVEVETELLRRAMSRARGNKAKAARLLGVTRPRLYRRLVQLGLAPQGEEG